MACKAFSFEGKYGVFYLYRMDRCSCFLFREEKFDIAEFILQVKSPFQPGLLLIGGVL